MLKIYFSINDVRNLEHNDIKILIRKVKSYQDYKGSINNFSNFF